MERNKIASLDKYGMTVIAIGLAYLGIKFGIPVYLGNSLVACWAAVAFFRNSPWGYLPAAIAGFVHITTVGIPLLIRVGFSFGRVAVTACVLFWAGSCMLKFIRFHRSRDEDEESEENDWMTPEEARDRADEVGDHLNVRVGEPISMSGPEFLQMLEEQSAQDPGSDEESGYSLTITMNAPIQPMERGERFEDPLVDALGDMGRWIGGGTSMSDVDGEDAVTCCDIELEVMDLEEGLKIIRKTLKKAGAPKKTTVTQYEPQKIVHQLYN